ncbi:hypothetical protein MSPP1_001765 [Malassezia sp. CBS 17886]|nr:hypothetical protein MSPP1_001765 [Malassezia sp. CBS 17886]
MVVNSTAMRGFLDKMRSADADYRFMALSDLAGTLVREAYSYRPLDEATEAAAVQQVLELLRDSNTEVKNEAVKTLGTLATRVRDAAVRTILARVCTGVLSEDEKERDIASLALRAVNDELASDGALAAMAAHALVPPLAAQTGAHGSAAEPLRLAALDALLDTVTHYGVPIAQDAALQQGAMDALLRAFHSGRPSMARRAIAGLGALAAECTPALYAHLQQTGLARLRTEAPAPGAGAAGGEGQQEQMQLRQQVQLLGVLARETPRRMRASAAARVDELLRVLTRMGDDAETDELREVCLQALDALLATGAAALPIGAAAQAAVQQLAHDPNLADADVEEDADEWDEYSDNDDVSWRVRRAAARALATLAVHHSAALQPLTHDIALALVARLGEREESVRLELLATLSVLLERVLGARVPGDAGYKRKWGDEVGARAASTRAHLEQTLLPTAVHALCRAVRRPATQAATLDTLRVLAATFGAGLRSAPEVLAAALHAPRTPPKTAAAATALLAELCRTVPAALLPALPDVVGALVRAAESKTTRAAVHGLVTCATLVEHVIVLRVDVAPADVAPHVAAIARVAEQALARADGEQTLKEAALSTLTAILCTAGDLLGPGLGAALHVVQERLANEVTRRAALAVVSALVACERVRSLDEVSQFALACVDVLPGMARLADRGVRAQAHAALLAVLALLRERVPPATRAQVAQALAANVSADADDPALPPLLAAADLLVQLDPSLAPRLCDTLLPRILPRVSDARLSAETLDALCALLRALSAASDALAPSLVAALEAQCAAAGVGAAPTPLAPARCLGAAGCTAAGRAAVLDRVGALMGATPPPALALYAIGVLGQQESLAGWPQAHAVFAQLRAGDDAAHVYAMGGMVLADAQLLDAVQERIARGDTGALRVVRDALAQASEEQLRMLAGRVWPTVAGAAECLPLNDASQATLDLACECLARMLFADAPAGTAALARMAHAAQATPRAVALGTVRAVVTLDRAHALDEVLAPQLWTFLQCMGDEELGVRAPAVLALHATVYNRPELVADHLGVLLPYVYAATTVREELKRKVTMGPFTVTTDDGLDLRKNAFETILTLLETCRAQVAMRDVLDRVIPALVDDDSIKLLACLVLVRLADQAPEDVLAALPDLCPPLQAIIDRPTRDSATKQEVEKTSELTYAAVRVLARLAAVEYAATHPALGALLAHTQQTAHGPLLGSLLDA